MINRIAHRSLQRLARGFPVIVITGPRQSGKTTLARAAFPDKAYLSLEDPDIRTLAENDPRGLLRRFPDGAVLDEAQRVPALFSYLQTAIDADLRPGMFVLTGSQQFGLLSGITQSLAGRAGMVQLLPFSIDELDPVGELSGDLDEIMFRGFYPPIYDRDITPGDWYTTYVSTYVERDVRQLITVRDLSAFQRFLKMCAGRTAQLLNLSGIATDCGITHNTAAAWLSVLEASYIVFLLRPHFRNYSKRLVKTPKIYFYDTGLAGWLMGIREPAQLAFHSQRGALFENLVVAETLKSRFNRGLPADLYFWRDSRGLEVDLLLENGEELWPIEIKSGQTIASDFFSSLKKWTILSGREGKPAWLVYGGDREMQHDHVTIVPWRNWPMTFGKI
ncbi:MAG: ATP-binding protein [Pseudomonadota bacterium]